MSGDPVAELAAALSQLPDDQVRELRAKADQAKEIINGGAPGYWQPQPGPQTDAYYCEADILLFGGRAGSGKSDIGLGLAFTKHTRTLVIRKQFNHLSGLVDRAAEIKGTERGLRRQGPPRLTIRGSQLINFGCLSSDGSLDAHQGIPHDLIYIDEGAQLQENLIRTTIAWNRRGPGVPEDQRCRVVIGSNPPLSDEGAWMYEMFSPWLDPDHPNPAEPGELRWYVTDAHGEDCAVPGPGVYEFDHQGLPVPSDLDPRDDDAYSALSRTFIPGSLRDNRYLGVEYKRNLDNLKGRERAALRDGDFSGARIDHGDQVIPSDWIQAAMDRWTPDPPDGIPMCNIGVDVGKTIDDTVLSPRHDGWFAPLIIIPSEEGNTGKKLAGIIMAHRENKADITIDMGGGYGDSVYEHLAGNIEGVYRHKGSEKTEETTEAGNVEFANTRAKVFWRLREALDPDQPGGSRIMLPRDPRLKLQLASIRQDKRWTDSRVIKLEPKVDLVKRLGYSPNEADAVSISWSRGATFAAYRKVWKSHKAGSTPQVRRSGRSHTKRRR